MRNTWMDGMQAGARGEQLAEFVKEQGHEAAQIAHDNTDKAADMLTDAAKKARATNASRPVSARSLSLIQPRSQLEPSP